MKSLDKIVTFYLNTETQNALMITGDWGAGKTYYFKNITKVLVSETSVPIDNRKHYKPILISLFGLKSIDDIQTEIFLNLYPLLKNKKVKLASNVIKALAKGIIQLSGLGEYKNIASEVNFDKSTFINFSELVICFDDLERKSPNLSLDELIGYINTLVDLGTKVILIANEQKIEDNSYIALKEKLIGTTIEFKPEIEETYESILSLKYEGIYKEYLQQNKDLIIEIFSRDQPNFRTLIFTLNYFKVIFAEIKTSLFQEKGLFEREIEILKNLLHFSLAVGIEYKKGEISSKNKRRIDDSTTIFIKEFMKNNYHENGEGEVDIEEQYAAEFIEKYYGNKVFTFYPSVFNFLTGGAIFDYNILIDELKTLYHINDNLSPEYKVYHKLSYPSCFKLDDDSHLKSTKELLQFALKGTYYLEDYLTVFYFITRFGNPLDVNPENLVKDIVNAIEQNLGKLDYHHIDDYLRISDDSDFKPELEILKKSILDFNSQILIQKELEEAKKLEALCYMNFNDFFNSIYQNEGLRYKPFLNHFDYKSFSNFFSNSSNETKWEVTKFFIARYNGHANGLRLEFDFINGLKGQIDKKRKELNAKNITWFIFADFTIQLDKVINEIEKYTKATH